MCYCNENNVRNTDWKRYLNKNTGRHDFQIDSGIYLLKYGITLDWKGNKRPSYMRTDQFIPYECEKCYFCMNMHTSGIDHKRKSTPEHMRVGGKKVKMDMYTNERVKLQESGD